MTGSALELSGLSVVYRVGASRILALDDIDLTVPAGHRMAVVGESGSGKSTLGLAIIGLLPGNASLATRRVVLNGSAVDLRDAKRLRALRGRQVSMVFQDAKAALDPVRTVGSQIAEPLRVHDVVRRGERSAEVERLLAEVEIPQPGRAAQQYPHELSGGMRQRAMIAAALAGRPALLIADEPTSALDVTTQATVIDLVRRLGGDGTMATLLITHDLALVAGFAETVTVMYAGQIVEVGQVDQVYTSPLHPYTRALLASIPSLFGDRMSELGSIPGSMPDLRVITVGCRFEPRCPVGRGRNVCRTVAPSLEATESETLTHGGRARCHFPGELPGAGNAPAVTVAVTPRRVITDEPIAELRSMVKTFQRRGARTRRSQTVALNDVDLTISAGESVGIVGESGSGKTTLARIFVGLERADSGVKLIRQGGELVATPTLPRDFVQFVFQDPGDSLNPLMSVGDIVVEPLVIRDRGRPSRYRDRAVALLDDVGLGAEMIDRRPVELSGGQRQRVAIARALSVRPKVVIADEAVASLDMSARGQILNLFNRLQAEHGFAYVYISHDLSMVRHVCDRVIVMYGGQVMETASTEELFVAPRHPYTQALISAIPIPDPATERGRRRVVITGELTGETTSRGCAFRTRCPIAQERCQHDRPALVSSAPDGVGHAVACHFAGDAAALIIRNPELAATSG